MRRKKTMEVGLAPVEFSDLNLRSGAGKLLLKWRGEFIAGRPAGPMKPGESVLIEMACLTRLYVNHFDAFILTHASLFSRKNGKAHPLLAQREVHAARLCSTLQQLGVLQRGQELELAASSPQAALNAFMAKLAGGDDAATANAAPQSAAGERTELILTPESAAALIVVPRAVSAAGIVQGEEQEPG